MKPFLDEDFLLSTHTARALYHGAAEEMPIFDYHCHLNPAEIADNLRFRNATHLFLGGDHYKWRAMRSDGVEEDLVCGGANDEAKFLAFARALPRLIGNPLYHWTHLELRRAFGIKEVLNEESAPGIYARVSEMLAGEDFRAQRLIEKFNVRVLCTTDDPADDLAAHERIAADPRFAVRVLPAFRPDAALRLRRPGFANYVERLSGAAGASIRNLDDLLGALERRVDFFHAHGARISDHALDRVPFAPLDWEKADRAFRRALRGEQVGEKAAERYQTALLVALGRLYARRGWAQQYHIGAMRDNNARMYRRYGPDAGFDSILDEPFAYKLSRLLDEQEREGALPKTVLYGLNPAANYAVATMLGNFQQGGEPGKLQMGSGWWFQDQRDGMMAQLRALANLGVLGRFIGMLTDSRSFVSYPRHEYFRRVLCELIGGWVENGEYPDDMAGLTALVRGICYDNALTYFAIDEGGAGNGNL